MGHPILPRFAHRDRICVSSCLWREDILICSEVNLPYAQRKGTGKQKSNS